MPHLDVDDVDRDFRARHATEYRSRFFVLTATAYNLVRIPKLSRQRDECVWSDENEAKIRELGAIGADTLVYPHVPDLQTLKELSKKHVFSAAC